MRDLKRDLEICEKATPAPWEWFEDVIEHKYIPTSVPAVLKNNNNEVVLTAESMLDSRTGEWRPFIDVDEDDMKFITETRQALPYWLQRVQELENALKIAYKALTEGMADVVWEKRNPKCSKLRAEAKRVIRKVLAEEDIT